MWKYIKPLEHTSSVDDFLKKNSVKLPETLVNLLKKYNGGRPSVKRVVTDTGREYVFKSLLSYNPYDKETIQRLYPEIFGDTALFPIGSDSAGNFICFNTKSQSYVLYNHETGNAEEIVECPFLPQH